MTWDASPWVVDRALDGLAKRAAADDDPAPASGRERTAGTRRAAERGREHVESLVLFQAADRQQDRFAGGDAVTLPDNRPFGRAGKRRRVDEIDPVRDRPHLFRAWREMPGHDRLERDVGRDDRVGGPRAAADGPSKRRVAGALRPGEGAAGGAELFESLRVEDERRERPALRTRPRIAEHARAETVDDIDVPGRCQPPREPARPQTEEQVRGAAIENRRAAPVGERERQVRHVADRDARQGERIARPRGASPKAAG